MPSTTKKYSETMINEVMQRRTNEEEISAETRKKIGVGNIRINRIQCLKCKDIITSTHRHHMQYCKCESVAVDGGSWYGRRLGKPKNYKDLSVKYKDINKDEEYI